MTVDERAEIDFVRAWNTLMDERDLEERAKWPLRREGSRAHKAAA